MKFAAIVAMLLAAIDCAEYATGGYPQHIFSASTVWLWWVGALAWIINAVSMLFCTVE